MDNKYMVRKGLDKFGRLRLYFIAGHTRWFIFIISLTQFGLIFYNFMWIHLDFIPNQFKGVFVFFLLWFLFYFPFATVFGYFDLTRGTYKAEVNVSLEVNPIWKRLFQELAELRKSIDEIEKQLWLEEK